MFKQLTLYPCRVEWKDLQPEMFTVAAESILEAHAVAGEVVKASGKTPTHLFVSEGKGAKVVIRRRA
jgi:hypothetical protein